MRMKMKINRLIFLISAVFFLIICTGCIQNVNVNLTDVSLRLSTFKVSQTNDLILRYSTEPLDTSKIYVETRVYKGDEWGNNYSVIGYNPFSNYFDEYLEDNKDCIEEDSIQVPEDKGLLAINYIGKKAVSGDERIKFRIKETGKYIVSVVIFSNDTKYLPSKVVHQDKTFEVK